MVVDETSGSPLKDVHVQRYAYHVHMLTGYGDDRAELPRTNGKGLTQSGLIDSGFWHTYRFDAKGYSPALAYETSEKGHAGIISPWTGDARDGYSVRTEITGANVNIVPMRPLAPADRDVDTAALFPKIPKHWDGVWRMQVVDAVTGIPLVGVEARYYRHFLYGEPFGDVVTTVISGQDGVIATRLPSQPEVGRHGAMSPPSSKQPNGIHVLVSKEGYLPMRIDLTTSFADVECYAPTDSRYANTVSKPPFCPAHYLITVPLWKEPKQRP